MDNLLHLALEAHSDKRDHHRRYEITLGRDLLDCWTFTIRYSRVGRGGQEKRYSSESAGEIRKVIAEHLRRRRSAPRLPLFTRGLQHKSSDGRRCLDSP